VHALWIGSGLVLGFLGCCCFYVASPHQGMLRTKAPLVPSVTAGGVLVGAGLGAFALALYPSTALVVFATWVMVVLTALPHLGAFALALRQEH